MAFNGAGVFTVTSTGYPVVYDTVISETAFNNIIAELAAGLSQAVAKDGQSILTQNIPWHGKRITNLGDATAAKDALNGLMASTNKFSYASSLGGTANALTIGTLASPDSTYTAGLQIWFKPTAANTGAVTVDVNSLGVKALTRAGTTALSPGDLQIDSLACIVYDGTQFQLVTPYYAEGSWTPSVGGTATYTTQLGKWTKLGRLVHITGELQINVIGTGSAVNISTLPFASASTGVQSITVGDFASLATNVVWIGARVTAGSTTLALRSLTAAGASAAATNVLGNGSMVSFSGAYVI